MSEWDDEIYPLHRCVQGYSTTTHFELGRHISKTSGNTEKKGVVLFQSFNWSDGIIIRLPIYRYT
jgi:hypothetical protein